MTLKFLESVTEGMPEGVVAYKAGDWKNGGGQVLRELKSLEGDGNKQNSDLWHFREDLRAICDAVDPNAGAGKLVLDLSCIGLLKNEGVAVFRELKQNLHNKNTQLNLVGLQEQPYGKIKEMRMTGYLNATQSSLNDWAVQQGQRKVT